MMEGRLWGGDADVVSGALDLTESSMLRCSKLFVASGVLLGPAVSTSAVIPKLLPPSALISLCAGMFAGCAAADCGSDRLLPGEIAFRMPTAFFAGDCSRPLWLEAFGEVEAVDAAGLVADPVDGVLRCSESRRDGGLSSFAGEEMSLFVIRPVVPKSRMIRRRCQGRGIEQPGR